MFELKVENKNGQTLRLTQNEGEYQVVDITGLNPPKANIYTNTIAGMDGEKMKGTRLEMRNVVLTIKVNGSAEENRLQLYEYFRTGQWCKIFYSNGTRNVFIEGYCETIECPLFTVNQQMQVSVICPDPYLKSVREIYADISKIFGNFSFPFDIAAEGVEFSMYDAGRETMIVNAGELPTGIKITLRAIGGSASNPVIYNVDTSEYIKLNLTMLEGDMIIISTHKGSKSAKKIANAVETNVINYIESGSSWLQLNSGANKFSYSASGDEHLNVEFESNILYEGV